MEIRHSPASKFATALEGLITDTAQLSQRDVSEVRPFVCNGSPTDCNVFIVGTNAASAVTWSRFWDHEREVFDKTNWLRTYEAERAEQKRSRGKTRFRAQSPTRSRIELFVNAVGGINQVLETNIYSVSTPSEKDLKPADRATAIFEFLLETIKPKALFVHGDTASSYFRENYGVSADGELYRVAFPHGECPAIFVPHLAARMGLVTNAQVVSWAHKLMAVL